MHGFTKGPEPQAFADWKRIKRHVEHCELAEVAWSELPGEVKRSVQEALLESQGALCAYCRAQIKRESMRIEHWVAQTTNPALRFEWENLLGVCQGDDGMETHCDNARGSRSLAFKPDRDRVADFFFFVSMQAETRVEFSKKAGGEASDIETLNLNAKRLCRNRRKALETLEQEFAQKYPRQLVPKAELIRHMTWRSQLPPYFQVVRPFLERLLSKVK